MAKWNQKLYLYKVYDSSGNFLTTWNDVVNEPTFSQSINYGNGEMTVELARTTKDFGETDDVAYNNEVKVYCFDRDTGSTGILVYDGYIAKYNPIVDGHQEKIEVILWTYAAEMARTIHETAAESTTINYAAQNPKDILEDIIDKYQATLTRYGATSHVTYNAGSIDDPGTAVTYEFNIQTSLECLQKNLELSPVGWYWYLDADNLIQYHAKSATADHTFYIGNQVVYIQPEKRIEDMVNLVYFKGGDPGGGILYKKYERAASIALYGLYSRKYIDERVTIEATADTMTDRLLDAFESPEIRTHLRILDNNGMNSPNLGYDIESIHVGDTIKTIGYSRRNYTRWDSGQFDMDAWDYDITDVTATVMQIHKLTYHPGYLELEATNRLPDVAKRIEDINRNLVASLTNDTPATPIT